MHEQQQFRGNQQMMNGLDYSGLSTGGGGGGGGGDSSYRFDAMPSGDERGIGNGVDAHDGLTTVLPTATDPLTFMQPSIVREEILAGSVPTIIHRHHPMAANQEVGDMHEMQTLISRGRGVSQNRHDSAEETVTVPSGHRGVSSSEEEEETEADVRSSNSSNNGPITSTPTKSVNGYVVMGPNGIQGAEEGLVWSGRRHPPNGTAATTHVPVQLPIVNLYRPQSPHCLYNNNNPKHVNKNSAALGFTNGGQAPPKRGGVQATMMNGGVPVYCAVSRKGTPQTWDFNNSGNSMRRSNGATAEPELDHLIRRRGDEDLDSRCMVHDNGYAEDEEEEDNSRTGLLVNGSGVSGVSSSLDESGNAEAALEKANGNHHLGSNALWDTFRRPIVGPNG